MRNTIATTLAVCLVSLSAFALAAAQQPSAQPVSATSTPTIDDVLKGLRADLQASRADIIAKNITLTSEQAAKFWPIYEKYQKEQNAIMDDQLKGIQRYVDSYNSLDDAAALGFINGHFDRDGRMNALRQKSLPEFQAVLPTRLAVRVLQIDRRLSLAHQIEISSRIPLVH